jgi:hypothetical protein
MSSDTAEIDRIGVGTRILRKATEAVDDGVNVGVAFSKINLTTTKLRLDWELSSESLEDGLEGADLEDHIARLMSSQAGQDLEDLAINGDSGLTADPLMSAFDGWGKRAELAGHIVDFGGANVSRLAFHRAIKAMPRRYMQRRNGLKFFGGSNTISDYLYSLEQVTNEMLQAAAVSANRPNVATGPAGFLAGSVMGVPFQEVPLMDETQSGTYSGATGLHSDIWLTFPQNLIWAIKRDIVVYREFKPKKDTIEYTMYCRVGTAIENADAFVVVKNVGIQL